MIELTGPCPPNGTLCINCSLRGHRCYARAYDADLSPACLDCIDGEPCIHMRRPKRDVPAPVPSMSGMKPGRQRTGAVCLHPGCKRRIAAHNRSGGCSEHCQWAQRNVVDGELRKGKTRKDSMLEAELERKAAE